MSRPVLDERLLAEVHAAFLGHYSFVESREAPEGEDVYHLGIARDPRRQLAALVCRFADALVNWSGVQPFADPPMERAFVAYLALRWCFNAKVDAGALLGDTPFAALALTGLCTDLMDEPARLAWDHVPWERLAYALHIAAKVHGLVIPGVTVDVPDGWTP